jgi:hypothetical protein
MIDAATLYAREERDLYIETVKGGKFFINHPEFDIEVMAHAMAHQCRYTGHVSSFYSVAEHSVLVSKLMEHLKLGDPFEGLMHDGAEAFISDIAAPWKVLLPDYKKVEAMIEGPLRKHFNLPATLTSGCKEADWLALFLEAKQLMVSKADAWTAPPGIKDRAEEIKDLPQFQVFALEPAAARAYFLQRYKDLSNARA